MLDPGLRAPKPRRSAQSERDSEPDPVAMWTTAISAPANGHRAIPRFGREFGEVPLELSVA